jgi:rubrerythrin
MFRNRPTNLGVDRIRVNRVRRPPRPPVVRVALVQVVDAAALVLAGDRAQAPVPAQVPVRDQALVAVPAQVLAQAHVRVRVQVAAGVPRAAAVHLPVPVRVRADPRVDRAAAPDRRDDSHMNFFEATMAIGAAEKLDIETAELLIRVENSGDVLYNELASRLNNEEAADLLRKNGREEVGHARRMMKVLSLKLGTEYVPSAEVLEKFEVDLPDSLDASSLPMIVEGELQGDIGYQKWASHETDPEIIELLLRNGREETKHAERIKQAIEILAAAEAAQ